jgi:hypothetical protein
MVAMAVIALALSTLMSTKPVARAESTPGQAQSSEHEMDSAKNAFVGNYVVQFKPRARAKIRVLLARADLNLPSRKWASIRGPVFNGITADLTRSQVRKLRQTRFVASVLRNTETHTYSPIATNDHVKSDTSAFKDAFIGKYVVQFKFGARAKIRVLLERAGVTIPPSKRASMRGPVFNGMTANLTRSQIRSLRQAPFVRSVGPNKTMQFGPDSPGDQPVEPEPIDSRRPNPGAKVEATAATSAWNLDRIDQRTLPLNDDYTPVGYGSGAHIYIVDSGVNLNLSQFSNRAGASWYHPAIGTDAFDCQGHGTTVASTAASASFGVAPLAIVHSVRVGGCTGGPNTSVLVQALNWIATNVQSPAVVNLSLGGDGEATFTGEAIKRLVNEFNIVVVASAGNERDLACEYHYANVPEVISVSSTDNVDVQDYYSNVGRCVDILAPGVDIPTVNMEGYAEYRNGTSYSAPAVSGAAAIARGISPSATSSQIKEQILESATPEVLALTTCGDDDGPCGTPNRLLYVGALNPLPAPPEPAGPTSPGKVKKLKTGKITSTTAVIKFKPPSSNGGRAITHFQDRIKRGNRGWSKWSVERKSWWWWGKGYYGAEWYKLKPGKKYAVQVRAENSMGAGPKKKIKFKTKK